LSDTTSNQIKAKWRVYFNSFDDDGLFWSIDQGRPNTEQKFRFLNIQGGRLTSHVDPENRGSEENPCAWFEVWGKLYTNGVSATIYGDGR
jgi:hypothetical protein